MLALAAGIPAMLTDAMTPMVFQYGDSVVAPATAAGFACVFFLSHLLGQQCWLSNAQKCTPWLRRRYWITQ